jgi:hypothetical protein
VRIVALTQRQLWVLNNGSHLIRNKEHDPTSGKLRSYDLREIRDFRQTVKSERAVRISFTYGGSRKRSVFTSKWEEGRILAKLLSTTV